MSLNSTTDHPIHIRIENSGSLDELAMIRAINEPAFGGSEEADLVDNLRAGGHALVSIVAELGARLVGHIMFSRMWINTAAGLLPAVALAPMAVRPDHQRRGIGTQLVLHGLELLQSRRERLVIVVGHPNYYPRFGFSSQKARLLQSPFPEEVFMAMELIAGALDGIQGPVVYPPPFGI